MHLVGKCQMGFQTMPNLPNMQKWKQTSLNVSVISVSKCINKLFNIYSSKNLEKLSFLLLNVSVLMIYWTITIQAFHDCFICYQAREEPNYRKWTFTNRIIGIMQYSHLSTIRLHPCNIPVSLISTLIHVYMCCIVAPCVSDVQLISCDIKKKMSNKTMQAIQEDDLSTVYSWTMSLAEQHVSPWSFEALHV